jgi:hypothetical protein
MTNTTKNGNPYYYFIEIPRKEVLLNVEAWRKLCESLPIHPDWLNSQLIIDEPDSPILLNVGKRQIIKVMDKVMALCKEPNNIIMGLEVWR